jgi:hypothetical protein
MSEADLIVIDIDVNYLTQVLSVGRLLASAAARA